MKDRFWAHISGDGRKQTVLEHLKGTAALTAEFAAEFEKEHMGYLIGLAHDIGKYTTGFQNRLNGGQRVDHSSAGAFEVMKQQQFHAAFCIAGHHGGIPDGGTRSDAAEENTLMGRIKKVQSGKVENYDAFRKEVTLPDVLSTPVSAENLLEECFLTRMLFSCLVDADYLDTERFMENHSKNQQGWYQPADMSELDKKVQSYISGWFPPENDLNRLRCEILDSCIQKGAQEKPGLFRLTVPTGGGKTVASLAFAVRHARTHGKKRIIYVIPYTSIIEQTAAVFKRILGEESVLEYHSGVIYQDAEGGLSDAGQNICAAENWDMPVIVTTAVQFFESLYSNRPSKCRKLHNIANSVIIFDEAQMLPISYLKPCVYGIAQLVKNYHVSAVLCTATQPALDTLLNTYLPDTLVRELCPKGIRQHTLFRRVSYCKAGNLSWETVGSRMNQLKQVLCIVNSRKNAYQLFQMLDEDGKFHLSTLMYPAHRRRILEEIQRCLTAGETCRVISTSLVEAGVDIDFPAVFREEAGLDSILQAAGRCNREGKMPNTESIVTIFQAESKPPHMFALPVGAFRSVLMDQDDIASESAIQEYFTELLQLKGEDAQDQKQILKRMEQGDFPFRSIAEDFKLIENDTKVIYIPEAHNAEWISMLYQGVRSKDLFRKLNPYGISVYKQHYDLLYQAGDLEVLDEGTAVLTNKTLYSEETGLSLEADFGKALFI